MRRAWWGSVAVVAYVATALALSGPGPVLPLYDAVPLAPEPYRWVDPPPEFEAANTAPEGAKQEVPLTEEGSLSANIATPDNQAVLVLRDGSFPVRLGEIAVVVDVRPVDPGTVDDPPEGVRFDGNAYVMSATYAKEGAAATLVNPGTVVLRSPLGGTRLLRHDGNDWAEISNAQPVAASLQVFGETTTLGTFVAAQTIHGKPFPWVWVSVGASAVAVGAGWFAAGRRRKSRRRPPRRDRRQAARTTARPRPDARAKRRRRR